MRLHPASLLVGAALLAGAIALSSAAPQNTLVATPRVTVDNPLGVPGWVPKDVWMARHGWNPQTGQTDYQDYTVPAGHFALVRTLSTYSDSRARVQVDEGSGFYDLAGIGYSSGDFDPGIVVDEGAVIRALPGNSPTTVHGYLIEKP